MNDDIKLKTIIVDDEPLALELLESYVKKTPFLELIGKYDSSVEAIQAIGKLKPDILFLDIQMPDMSGIELAKIISDKTLVIFVTAFQQYAIEGFKVNAIDYLLKPVSYAEFLTSAQKALKIYTLINNTDKVADNTEDNKTNLNQGYIFVKTEYKLIKVEVKDILYIEGLKDYVKIFIEGEKHPLVSKISMKQIEDSLDQNDFIRVHRSYIVRKDKIKVIERNRIVFGNEFIPVSDSYKEQFFNFLHKNTL